MGVNRRSTAFDNVVPDLSLHPTQGWRKNGAPFKLRYDTRPQSQTYLENLGENQTEDERLSTKNIDYFHLHQSYREINKWFENHGQTDNQREEIAAKLRGYLYDSIGVIWYEASSTTSATELFTRLNVGRIPLTDAELVKAALLTAIRTPDRAQEIAAQWDGIERDLHQPDIWAFVAGLSANSHDEQYPTRISLLLDTLADAPKKSHGFAGKRPRYYTFDQLRDQIEKNPIAFWEQIVALHAQILGWFAMPKIYNKIGFLVTDGKRFGEIADEANGMKKSAFDAHLTKLIQEKIKISEEDVEALGYENKPKTLQLLLLLMNVETVSKAGHRFPFAQHIKKKWSLEHIHAQNAGGLNKAEQWCSWLENHRNALQVVQFSQEFTELETMLAEIDAAITKIKNNPQNSGSNVFSGQDYQACMLRKDQMNSYHADPYLGAIVEVSEISYEAISNTNWPNSFYGYETNPRWLHLKKSDIKLRSVDAGWEVSDIPSTQQAIWQSVIQNIQGITVTENSSSMTTLLEITKNGEVDSVDRVEVAANLLKTLVAHGF